MNWSLGHTLLDEAKVKAICELGLGWIPIWPGLKRVIGRGSSVLLDTCVLNREIVT